MKKLLLLLMFILSLTGCSKNKVKDVPVDAIISNIEKNYPINNSIKEDLKQQDIAERYGISPDDIEEGVVYYTEDKDKADKIIIFKAKSKENIESLERAISSEIVGMSDSWKNNETEAKKVDNHLFKTKETYVIYCVSDNAEKIVELFDNMLESK